MRRIKKENSEESYPCRFKEFEFFKSISCTLNNKAFHDVSVFDESIGWQTIKAHCLSLFVFCPIDKRGIVSSTIIIYLDSITRKICKMRMGRDRWKMQMKKSVRRRNEKFNIIFFWSAFFSVFIATFSSPFLLVIFTLPKFFHPHFSICHPRPSSEYLSYIHTLLY